MPRWVVFAAALLVERHRIFIRRIERNATTTVAEALLALFGMRLGHRVHRQLGLERLGGLPEVNPARCAGGVASRGLYARVRHPRYLPFMTNLLGFPFLTGGAGIFALAFVTILMYLIVAPLEERELHEHYGAEYEHYARRVPRFLPHLRRNPWGQ